MFFDIGDFFFLLGNCFSDCVNALGVMTNVEEEGIISWFMNRLNREYIFNGIIICVCVVQHVLMSLSVLYQTDC